MAPPRCVVWSDVCNAPASCAVRAAAQELSLQQQLQSHCPVSPQMHMDTAT
jgi:hypothetical protein